MKAETKPIQLRRTQIREVLRRHRGTMITMARELEVHPSAVSSWLAGHTSSRRIADALHAKAVELLGKEAHAA